jgi:hypothetical protein
MGDVSEYKQSPSDFLLGSKRAEKCSFSLLELCSPVGAAVYESACTMACEESLLLLDSTMRLQG